MAPASSSTGSTTSATGSRATRAERTGVAVAAVLVVMALVFGEPLHGAWDWRPTTGLLPVVVFGAVLVWQAPSWSQRLRWWPTVVLASCLAVGWATAVAAAHGLNRVAAPLTRRHDYLAVLPAIDGVGSFLETFTERLAAYPVHVQGHPPGLPLLLVGLDRVGLDGPGWAAVVILTVAAVGVGAVLVAAKDVAGEAAARRVAPFLVLAPAAVWVATSADALFAGVAAVGVALVVVASGRARVPLLAVAGGAVFGAALHLTYGVLLLLLVPVAVAVKRRRLDVLLWAAAGGVAVTAVFVASGFWWLDGLAATRERYEVGIAARRSYLYFTLAGNPAAFVLAIGPAAVAGLAAGVAAVRRHALTLLVLPALAAVVIADVSGLSKGEVERIWLPYVPWVVLAAGIAVSTVARPRLWLAAQAGVAILLSMTLRSPW